jgi:hypothetical protein
MRRLLVALVLLTATMAVAEELTVGMILSAHRAGADAAGLVKLINDPVYTTMKVSAADLDTLKAGGIPSEAIAALQARMPVPTPAPAPSKPDDPRLGDIVRLVKSGLSEAVIMDQIKGSSQPYELSVNDLVYLKENGVSEPVIKELLATKGKAGTAPVAVAPTGGGAPADLKEVSVEGVVLVKPTFLKKNRPGRIVMLKDSIQWIDGNDPVENVTFNASGIEKVWLSCQARTTENFCYQINIQIVKGARYRFQDRNRETGSNEGVLKLEQLIKSRYPTAPFGPQDVEN